MIDFTTSLTIRPSLCYVQGCIQYEINDLMLNGRLPFGIIFHMLARHTPKDFVTN